MPEKWDWPVQLPRFTTKEYEQRKEDHVKEMGYRVHVPGFEDIIHINAPPKATEQELKHYYLKAYDKLGITRYNEINGMFIKRRDRINRMLDSPSPIWYQNMSSVMTFIDDLEDSLSTVAMIARVAARVAPRLLGKLMRGPIGWILLINDILNISQLITCFPMAMGSKKRFLEDLVLHNPFSKKARLKRALKTRKWWPSMGDILETLQTTDNMFGIGISLGPIVGFMADSAFGTYRMIRGDEVKWGSSPPEIYPHELSAFRAFRGLATVFLADKEFSDDDKFTACLVANLALQVVRGYWKEWNVFDHLTNIDDIELIPPTATNPITRAVMEGAGVNPDTQVGFIHFSPEDGTFKSLSANYMTTIANNYNKYSHRNQNNMKGWVAANNVTEYSESFLAMIEDTTDLETPLNPTPQALLNAMQEKFNRDQSIQELNALQAQLDASLALESDIEQAAELLTQQALIDEERKKREEYRRDMLILQESLAFYSSRWPGYYHGRVSNFPPKGMVAGPIEWEYEKSYHEIWNPPQSWRNLPKKSNYDKISWFLEHPATPWYIRYCLWGQMFSGNSGWVSQHWGRQRGIAEAKIPYSYNPHVKIKGHGTIRDPHRVDIWLYCKDECQLSLLPDYMQEFLQDLTDYTY